MHYIIKYTGSSKKPSYLWGEIGNMRWDTNIEKARVMDKEYVLKCFENYGWEGREDIKVIPIYDDVDLIHSPKQRSINLNSA